MAILIQKRTLFITICMVLLGIICCFILFFLTRAPARSSNGLAAGGSLTSSLQDPNVAVPVMNQENTISSERFQRPSKAFPYPNLYSFKDFQKENEKPPLIEKRFENSEDLIFACYGILREASNMVVYSGGCGTGGWAKTPYSYAYELLTKERQKEVPLNEFHSRICTSRYACRHSILYG